MDDERKEKEVNNVPKRHKTASYLAKVGMFSALSFVLYLVRFPLPFVFPFFLELHFSELPAIICGFSLGPLAGSVVIVIKVLLKLLIQGTKTAFIGELGDLLIGVAVILPSSLVYKFVHDKKGAFYGLLLGVFTAIAVALVVNRFLLIPFYADYYGFDALVSTCSVIFPKISEGTFYSYYLWLSVLPFNFLKFAVTGLVTFLVYKRISRLLSKF